MVDPTAMSMMPWRIAVNSRVWSLHERHPGVQLHVDAAVGALLDQVDPDLGALAPRERGADDGRHLVLVLVLRLRQRRGGERGGNQCRGSGHQKASFHVSISSFESRSA
jgi:hypothetical protein